MKLQAKKAPRLRGGMESGGFFFLGVYWGEDRGCFLGEKRGCHSGVFCVVVKQSLLGKQLLGLGVKVGGFCFRGRMERKACNCVLLVSLVGC